MTGELYFFFDGFMGYMTTTTRWFGVWIRNMRRLSVVLLAAGGRVVERVLALMNWGCCFCIWGMGSLSSGEWLRS